MDSCFRSPAFPPLLLLFPSFLLSPFAARSSSLFCFWCRRRFLPSRSARIQSTRNPTRVVIQTAVHLRFSIRRIQLMHARMRPEPSGLFRRYYEDPERADEMDKMDASARGRLSADSPLFSTHPIARVSSRANLHLCSHRIACSQPHPLHCSSIRSRTARVDVPIASDTGIRKSS